MAASIATIQSQLNTQFNTRNAEDTFGKKIGIFASLFGCTHSRLTRPFSAQGENVGYRSCIQCGARKKFDLETRRTSGAAYYPPRVG